MFTIDIDLSRATTMREKLNPSYSIEEPAISITTLLIKACAAALQLHHILNGYFREEEILIMPHRLASLHIPGHDWPPF